MTNVDRWFGAVTAEVMLDPDLSMAAKAVYGVLAVHADRQGICFVSNSHTAHYLGVTRNTVIKALKALEDAGVVSREPRFIDGIQRSNLITLLDIQALKVSRK